MESHNRIINDIDPLLPGYASPLVLAGPCSAESAAQTLATAEELAAEGIRIFRAGLWKPRTKPGAFEGVGAAGLPWLAEVKARTGMLTATEVAVPEHLEAVAATGVDAVWIGARTSANPFAVQQLADCFASMDADRRRSLAVIVKNPVSPDLELWTGALERIYAAGVRRLAASHRGFSLYGESRYRNAPVWRIPIELHRRLPHLPLLCDPSHIAGRRDLVEPVARQAMRLGFDGLMIESHCSPDRALSDAAQQLTPSFLGAMLRNLPPASAAGDSSDILADMRARIDALDDELLDILSRRMAVACEIGEYKKEHSMPVLQPDRYSELMTLRRRRGRDAGLDDDFVAAILGAIHEESVRLQLKI